MALISDRYGFLFIMAPRTGCTAIAYDVLVPKLGAVRVPWKDVLDDDGNILVDSKHGTLGQLIEHGYVLPEKAERLFKFCSVRNPFDSLVSLYTKHRTIYSGLANDPKSFLNRKPNVRKDQRRAEAMSFSDWVVDRYTRRASWKRGFRRRLARPQHMYGRYIDGMDHIMRFERLKEDLDEVLSKVGAPSGFEIENLNPTPDREKDYRTYYTDEARAIVEHVFRPDLERFGYRF